MRFVKRIMPLVLVIAIIFGSGLAQFTINADDSDNHLRWGHNTPDTKLWEDNNAPEVEVDCDNEPLVIEAKVSDFSETPSSPPVNKTNILANLDYDNTIVSITQTNEFVIAITPLQNDTATIIYTDPDSGNTATLTLTISNVVPLTYSYYVFSQPGPPTKIDGDSYQVTDISTDFLLRDNTGKDIAAQKSDFTIDDENNLDIFSSGKQNAFNVRVFNREGGTITHKATGAELTINASNVPTSYSLWHKSEGTIGVNFVEVYSGTSQEHIDRSTLVLFEHPGIDKIATPNSSFTVKNKTGDAFRYEFKNNEHVFEVDRSKTGTSSITLATTIGGKEYTFTKTITYTEPQEQVTTITETTIDAINAAITNSEESTPGEPVILQLPDGDIIAGTANTVNLSKRVTLRGGNNTVIKGGVNITANVPDQGGDGAAARLENLTLEGNGTGTGITGTSTSYAAITKGVTIKNFDVGFDNTQGALSFALGGIHFENNDIALILKSVSGQRQSTGGFTFKDNETAIQIETGGNNNAYAFKLHTSNFIDNDVNIKNNTDIAYNFALNHYDDVEEKFTGTTVVYYPYYDGELVLNNGIIQNEGSLKLMIDEKNLGNVPMENGAVTKLSATNFAGKDVSLQMDKVNDNGSADKVASWGFNASSASNPSVTSFNPTIDTTLRPGSNPAIAKIPTGTTYQPVSFAHSGALPGVATVNLVQTDEAAPTNNLKLYKVVNNQLVKQPEAVNFDGTQYTFLRPDCSDYIITDAEIRSTANQPSDNPVADSSADSYTSSADVASAIGSASNGVANVSVASRPLIGTAAFDTLRSNPGTTLVFQGDGYSWSFKGSDITGNVPGLVYLNTRISSTSPNQDRISRLAGGKELINVYFSHHGQLPGKATVTVEVPAKYNGQRLNVYYYNASRNVFEVIRLGAVAQNGRLGFDITHCSDYVITPEALPASAPTNPSTGRTPAAGSLEAAWAALLAAGMMTWVIRRKSKGTI